MADSFQISGKLILDGVDVTGAFNDLNAKLRQIPTGQVKALSADTKQAVEQTKNLNRVQVETGRVVNRTGKEFKQTASAIQDFGDKAGLALRRFTAFSIAAGGVFGSLRALRSGISDALKFNRELVRVAQVTGQTTESLAGLGKEITNLSIEFGTSSQELVGVAKTLSQAGLTARDTQKALRALAATTLAPTFTDIQKTTEGVIASLRQFNIEADEVEKSLGSINAVAGKFAVESDDLITGIRKAGAAFSSASQGIVSGNEALAQFIALFTSVRATTRESADTIGTGLRTITTRIQRPETIQYLRDFGVELTNLNGQFIGVFPAVQALGKEVQKLSSRDVRFTGILEAIGGYRQISRSIPLLQQTTLQNEALNVALQGQGSLARDAATAQKDLSVQLEQTKQNFAALLRDIANTNTFQTFIKLSLDLANALIKLADSAKEVIPVVGLVLGLRGVAGIASALPAFGTRAITGSAAAPIRRNIGGFVPGIGEGDKVPALLEPGEFVLNKIAVAKVGARNLDKLNSMIPRFGGIQTAQKGGVIGLQRGGRRGRRIRGDDELRQAIQSTLTPQDIPVPPLQNTGRLANDFEKLLGVYVRNASSEGISLNQTELRRQASNRPIGLSNVILNRNLEKAKAESLKPPVAPKDLSSAINNTGELDKALTNYSKLAKEAGISTEDVNKTIRRLTLQSSDLRIKLLDLDRTFKKQFSDISLKGGGTTSGSLGLAITPSLVRSGSTGEVIDAGNSQKNARLFVNEFLKEQDKRLQQLNTRSNVTSAVIASEQARISSNFPGGAQDVAAAFRRATNEAPLALPNPNIKRGPGVVVGGALVPSGPLRGFGQEYAKFSGAVDEALGLSPDDKFRRPRSRVFDKQFGISKDVNVSRSSLRKAGALPGSPPSRIGGLSGLFGSGRRDSFGRPTGIRSGISSLSPALLAASFATSQIDTKGSAGLSGLSGAVSGAAIGSLAGPLGTVLGGIVGGLTSAFSELDRQAQEKIDNFRDESAKAVGELFSNLDLPNRDFKLNQELGNFLSNNKGIESIQETQRRRFTSLAGLSSFVGLGFGARENAEVANARGTGSFLGSRLFAAGGFGLSSVIAEDTRRENQVRKEEAKNNALQNQEVAAQAREEISRRIAEGGSVKNIGENLLIASQSDRVDLAQANDSIKLFEAKKVFEAQEKQQRALDRLTSEYESALGTLAKFNSNLESVSAGLEQSRERFGNRTRNAIEGGVDFSNLLAAGVDSRELDISRAFRELVKFAPNEFGVRRGENLFGGVLSEGRNTTFEGVFDKLFADFRQAQKLQGLPDSLDKIVASTELGKSDTANVGDVIRRFSQGISDQNLRKVFQARSKDFDKFNLGQLEDRNADLIGELEKLQGVLDPSVQGLQQFLESINAAAEALDKELKFRNNLIKQDQQARSNVITTAQDQASLVNSLFGNNVSLRDSAFVKEQVANLTGRSTDDPRRLLADFRSIENQRKLALQNPTLTQRERVKIENDTQLALDGVKSALELLSGKIVNLANIQDRLARVQGDRERGSNILRERFSENFQDTFKRLREERAFQIFQGGGGLQGLARAGLTRQDALAGFERATREEFDPDKRDNIEQVFNRRILQLQDPEFFPSIFDQVNKDGAGRFTLGQFADTVKKITGEDFNPELLNRVATAERGKFARLRSATFNETSFRRFAEKNNIEIPDLLERGIGFDVKDPRLENFQAALNAPGQDPREIQARRELNEALGKQLTAAQALQQLTSDIVTDFNDKVLKNLKQNAEELRLAAQNLNKEISVKFADINVNVNIGEAGSLSDTVKNEIYGEVQNRINGAFESLRNGLPQRPGRPAGAPGGRGGGTAN